MGFFESTQNTKAGSSRENMVKKLQHLMFFRVVFLSFFLGITIVFQFLGIKSFIVPSLIPIYLLCGTTFFITIIYAILLHRISHLQAFCHAQIGVDVLLTTALIYATGGISSAFSFIYFLPIFTAAILLYRWGAYMTASLSSILYGAIIDFEYFGYIQPIHSSLVGPLEYGRGYVFYMLSVNITAFYLVAYLSSYLSEKEKTTGRELIRKEIDYKDLATLNTNIVQSMHSGLITIDTERRIVFLNKAGEKILGISMDKTLGHRIEEFFPSIQCSPDANTGSNGLSSRLEYAYTRHTGEQVYLGFSISNLFNANGDEIGNIIIFQDLTILKQMEESVKRSERMAAAGQLAAGMAHEIRNPLAAITGSIEMLARQSALTASERRLMDIVCQESDRLNSLITNFLCFARPDRVDPEQMDLCKVIEEVLELVQKMPEFTDNIQIIKHLSADGKIYADSQQIKQVLWNLYVNAIQAMPDGGRLITSLKPASVLGGIKGVAIEVKDTGMGIDTRNLHRIFDPFFTTRDSGFGLGLSVVHSIVENHGGRITVQGTKGMGTTFTIILPVGRASGETRIHEQS